MLLYSDAFLGHETPEGHPERAARLEACRRELREAGLWSDVDEPDEVALDLLNEVHTSGYVEEVRGRCEEGGSLDPDTHCGPGSFEAAVKAAGAAEELAELGVKGETGFGLVRPPGHHASASRGMGFCLFNNAAVCATRALEEVESVAVVDFDVHHGNGTQEIFYGDSRVLYCSMHRGDFYPGTGALEEIGEGEGEGFTVNVPLPRGSGDGDLLAVTEEVFLPAMEGYGPDLLILSAGYDAHRRDPLGGLEATESGFGAVVGRLTGVAPTVGLLEGGYGLEGLSRSVVATVEALGGDREFRVEADPSQETLERIDRARMVHGELVG